MPDLHIQERLVLALDIGGTKLAAGVVDASGAIRASDRMPTHASEGPDRVIDRLIALGRSVVAQAGVAWSDLAGVGVGCGGPLDPRSGVILGPPNLPGWVNLPLADRLHAALGLPVFVENDANAAALGEHRFGAGRGVANMVYFTISTGVGGGVILDGRLYHGVNGNAAELGHMVVLHGGRRCECGRKGCLEAYASGTAIVQRARERLGPDIESTEAVVAAVQAGDPAAVQFWDETMAILADGVANAIHAYNPARVVLGGGVTNAGELLFEPVRRFALRSVFPVHAGVVEIVPAALGNAVGIVGAAAVALTRRESAGEEVPARG